MATLPLVMHWAMSSNRRLPLLELAVFAIALVGFVVFYALERQAQRANRRSGGEPVAGVFCLHLGFYAVYNGLITYTMPLRVRTGLSFALAFSVAMGLHFVLTDRALLEHYPQRFPRSGRRVLGVALVAGFLVAWAAAPVSTVLVAALSAFLGGSVLWNVFRDEVPTDRPSSLGWFLTGLVTYGALLTALTVVAE